MPPPDPHRTDPSTLVIGVLGGIASGKSSVARLLAGPDGLVLDADRLAREALESPEGVRQVRERFGAEALGPDGKPDREALARLAFSDPQARRALEGWTHPAVRERIRGQLDDARAKGIPRVVLDVPLLLENDEEHGLARLCDQLVYVEADEDERERRAVRSRNWKPGEVARREAAQLPQDEKRRRADHVIANRDDLARLEADVHALLETLEGARSGQAPHN